jgi:hypothetical protein
VPGRTDLSDCRDGKRIHEGTYWGAAAKKRTAAIEPEKEDREQLRSNVGTERRTIIGDEKKTNEKTKFRLRQGYYAKNSRRPP